MKSPIKEKPLRNPGESVDRQIEDFIADKLLQHILIITVAVTFTMLEWYRWYFEVVPSPYFFSAIAAVAVVISGWKIYKGRIKLKALKQGRDGEKAVGQFLEQFRNMGAKVIHDVPADGFNIDHVIIASSGVYVVETKSYSKPDKGEAIVTYNGEWVTFNGKNQTDKPIIQVTAATNWLRRLLKTSTGKDFNLRAVVLFPGWYIQPTAEARKSDVWVLNPKALPAFVQGSTEHLSREDISMAALHLSRYVRTFEK